MALQIYVLKTCDTCRKALKWLESEGVDYQSIDVRTDGVPVDILRRALDHLGADKLVNKSSATWRSLDEDVKSGLDDLSALSLMQEHPTLMKRPLFQVGETFVCGFRDAQKDMVQSAL